MYKQYDRKTDTHSKWCMPGGPAQLFYQSEKNMAGYTAQDAPSGRTFHLRK